MGILRDPVTGKQIKMEDVVKEGRSLRWIYKSKGIPVGSRLIGTLGPDGEIVSVNPRAVQHAPEPQIHVDPISLGIIEGVFSLRHSPNKGGSFGALRKPIAKAPPGHIIGNEPDATGYRAEAFLNKDNVGVVALMKKWPDGSWRPIRWSQEVKTVNQARNLMFQVYDSIREINNMLPRGVTGAHKEAYGKEAAQYHGQIRPTLDRPTRRYQREEETIQLTPAETQEEIKQRKKTEAEMGVWKRIYHKLPAKERAVYPMDMIYMKRKPRDTHEEVEWFNRGYKKDSKGRWMRPVNRLEIARRKAKATKFDKSGWDVETMRVVTLEGDVYETTYLVPPKASEEELQMARDRWEMELEEDLGEGTGAREVPETGATVVSPAGELGVTRGAFTPHKLEGSQRIFDPIAAKLYWEGKLTEGADIEMLEKWAQGNPSQRMPIRSELLEDIRFKEMWWVNEIKKRGNEAIRELNREKIPPMSKNRILDQIMAESVTR